MRRGLLAILIVLGFAIGVWFRQTASPRFFYYDEADYMYAAGRGFLSNYLDRPSVPPVEFVRKGLELVHSRQRSDISKFIRDSGDVGFYRHYHGPVYAYWLAFMDGIGLRSPADFRASGLLIHLATSLVLFASFAVALPESPPLAALAGALVFLCGRTGILAATNITQHVMFGLVCAVALLPLALYSRTGNRRYWYLAVAVAGVAFATVETSLTLIAAILIVLVICEYQAGLRAILTIVGRGCLTFLGVLLAAWPAGILKLGAPKGYALIAYLTIFRKAYRPIGPMALWSAKLHDNPEEMILPLLAVIAATVLWQRLPGRKAALPYLVYAWLFFATTMVITAPFAHYYVSMMFTCAVITGIVFGEIWRMGSVARFASAALLLASLAYMDIRYHRETAANSAIPDPRVELMSFIDHTDRTGIWYVPYILVPTLHYYFPDLRTESYNETTDPKQMVASMQATGAARLLCELEVCEAVSKSLGLQVPDQPLMRSARELELGPVYQLPTVIAAGR